MYNEYWWQNRNLGPNNCTICYCFIYKTVQVQLKFKTLFCVSRMSIDKTLHCNLNMLTLFQQNPRNEMDKEEEEEQMWLDDEMDGMYVKLLLFK